VLADGGLERRRKERKRLTSWKAEAPVDPETGLRDAVHLRGQRFPIVRYSPQLLKQDGERSTRPLAAARFAKLATEEERWRPAPWSAPRLSARPPRSRPASGTGTRG
jgi:hypothetical protein